MLYLQHSAYVFHGFSVPAEPDFVTLYRTRNMIFEALQIERIEIDVVHLPRRIRGDEPSRMHHDEEPHLRQCATPHDHLNFIAPCIERAFSICSESSHVIYR